LQEIKKKYILEGLYIAAAYENKISYTLEDGHVVKR
jgi:hypothetical protein